MGSRSIFHSFLTSVPEAYGVVNITPHAALPPCMTRYLLYRSLGEPPCPFWTGMERGKSLASTGVPTAERQTLSENSTMLLPNCVSVYPSLLLHIVALFNFIL